MPVIRSLSSLTHLSSLDLNFADVDLESLLMVLGSSCHKLSSLKIESSLKKKLTSAMYSSSFLESSDAMMIYKQTLQNEERMPFFSPYEFPLIASLPTALVFNTLILTWTAVQHCSFAGLLTTPHSAAPNS